MFKIYLKIKIQIVKRKDLENVFNVGSFMLKFR